MTPSSQQVQSSQPKAALLTGVGRREGIAAAIALALAADGWDLALVTWTPYDRRMTWGERPDDLARLVDDVEALGRRVVVLEADLSDPDVALQLVTRAADALGPVSGLVLSHSESVDSGILDTTVEAFDRHYDVNVRAAWLLIKGLAEQIPESGGRIVALTSDHVVDNMPYGSSKGALDRIVIAAARELGHLGISSNALNPGPVDTGWMSDEVRETLTAMQPTGRLGLPGDVANIVRFLLGPEGGWVSGQLIVSNGGFNV
ncbi:MULTISPECIES: SDR family oxidoreductase [unclassified Frondihabitans]|uniref:SDR family oxidoreductase n=1 Tax=unclassified Frondihabitans TaxID=2626248 RepID=UPI0006FC59AC|nr:MULTISPECIES: SDR family oxidoreductase [unclassified Frondihabitans]KQQ25856.1 short-chain dehydrogenase [Frondihabitans sp. Leaf304]RPE73423.1 3-oxoacyl-[acyl-carrier protein] reductase [Frondihabitans sp. PhB153]RPF01521.1 3-oxoacyl-[acyl-carrier protein] reductase [Frondihabitans sp. PhB161]